MKIETHEIFQGASVPGRQKIICASLFRMKKSYRGFQKYLDFAIHFVTQVKRILPDWVLRVYVDESLKQSEVEMLYADHVEIVLYKCDDFWDAESGTHEGTFGTFMRFLPMFSAQKYVAMASSDIDIGDFILEYFAYFDKHAQQVGLVNQLCYNDWIPENLRYSILAGGIYTKIVFPRLLLTSFLKDVKAGKVHVHITKNTDQDTYVPYGTDEYFLTTKLYNYLEKHKIKVMTATISTVVGAIRKVLKLVDDKDRLKQTEKVMKKLTYIDHEFWKDPRKLGPSVFKKHLKEVIEVVEPELERSRHKQCITEYLKNPKVVEIRKYNY
jgi:hypothetical protein